MPNSRIKTKISSYAPKNTCNPVSIQSPSASFHADTLPPRIGRFSYSSTDSPASTSLLAAVSPASPPPTTITSDCPITLLLRPCQRIYSELTNSVPHQNPLGCEDIR